MRKIAFIFTLLLLLPSGCLFWEGDENENYSVRINNKTDDVIVAYYNINNLYYDGSSGDYNWSSSTTTSIAKDNYDIIYVAAGFYDADILIYYKGEIRLFDIDPDFWGWDEIDVNILDFS